MSHPIINASGTLLGMNFDLFSKILLIYLTIGVVEFYRTDSTIPFSEEDEEVCYIKKIFFVFVWFPIDQRI